jgi:ABC-type transport system substrate-binding protein
MVVYEQGSLPAKVHPFLLSSSPQELRLSALITERAAHVDASRNMLVLSLFQDPKSRGPRAWELSLKPGLKWSDGSPLTASDVATSFSRLVQMAQAEENPPLDAQVLARSLFLVKRIDVESPEKALFVFRQPVQPYELPAILAMLPIVPSTQTDAQLAGAGAVTCGPFMVQKIEKGLIELKANPYYYLGAPHIEGIEIRRVTPQELDAALVNEGSGQFAVQVPTSMLADLRKKPDLILKPANTRRMLYLGFNEREGSRFYDLPELKLAIASLIDRQALQDAVPDGGESRPLLTGPYSPDSPYADPLVEATPFSVPIAVQRLSQLGFRRVGETYKDAQGKPLRLRLLVSDAVPSADMMGKVIDEQLKREGIGVEIIRASAEDMRQIIQRPGGSFDLVLHQWLLDEGQDLYEIFHSKGLYNFLGFANTSVDERLVLDRHASLPESRVLYRREIHRILSREMPMVFLWELHDITVFRSDIEHVPPLDPYFVFRDVHRWTVGGEVSVSGDAAPAPGVAPAAAPAASPVAPKAEKGAPKG